MYVFKLITSSDRTDSNMEITRWVVKEVNESTIDKLREKLKSLFRTRSTGFFISWFDGEDYCTIREANDLMEAVEFMIDEEREDKAIRLFVSPDATEHKTIFGERPKDESDESDGGEVAPDSIVTATIKEEEQDKSETQLVEEASNDQSQTQPTSPEEEEEEREEATDNTEAQQSQPDPPQPAIDPLWWASSGQPLPAQALQQGMMPFPDSYLRYYQPGLNYNGGMQYPMYWPPTALPYVPSTIQPSAPPSALPTVPPTVSRCASIQLSTTPMVIERGPVPSVANVVSSSDISAQASTGAPITANRVQPVPVVDAKMERKVKPVKKEAKKPAKDGAKSSQVKMAFNTLRSLGYTQDEKALKRLIRLHNGSLNEIIDALQGDSQ